MDGVATNILIYLDERKSPRLFRRKIDKSIQLCRDKNLKIHQIYLSTNLMGAYLREINTSLPPNCKDIAYPGLWHEEDIPLKVFDNYDAYGIMIIHDKGATFFRVMHKGHP